MLSSRCSGRWSTYLLTIRWANSPGPGNPLAIGSAGLLAAVTTSGGFPADAVISLVWAVGSLDAGSSDDSVGVVIGSGSSRGTACAAGSPGEACCRALLQQGQAYL